MNVALYYALCGLCTLLVLIGINMMSKVNTAAAGNTVSEAAMVMAVVLTIVEYGIGSGAVIYVCLAAGFLFGILRAGKVKMIAMPQTVAMLNGLGGAASALVAGASVITRSNSTFENSTAGIALAVGALTFTGSLIAAWKLSGRIGSKPKQLPAHTFWTTLILLLMIVFIILETTGSGLWAIGTAVLALLGGMIFVMRVGGADMPIMISLLNSLSGVAGGIAGMAVDEPLLVAIGGIVGASGLILTQDMCRAMNRNLAAIITGKTTTAPGSADADSTAEGSKNENTADKKHITEADIADKLRTAKDIIIVPGYGMALSQAQQEVADLTAALERRGARVRFAIHPVAGRMPGHMSVLLCEVDIPYDKLCMMDDINPEFASCDLVIVTGANDVTNPAANTAEGTPIYGMPVLKVADAPMTVICNFDTKPGYAGVPNPLYTASNVLLMLGDAKESIRKLLGFLQQAE